MARQRSPIAQGSGWTVAVRHFRDGKLVAAERQYGQSAAAAREGGRRLVAPRSDQSSWPKEAEAAFRCRAILAARARPLPWWGTGPYPRLRWAAAGSGPAVPTAAARSGHGRPARRCSLSSSEGVVFSDQLGPVGGANGAVLLAVAVVLRRIDDLVAMRAARDARSVVVGLGADEVVRSARVVVLAAGRRRRRVAPGRRRGRRRSGRRRSGRRVGRAAVGRAAVVRAAVVRGRRRRRAVVGRDPAAARRRSRPPRSGCPTAWPARRAVGLVDDALLPRLGLLDVGDAALGLVDPAVDRAGVRRRSS